MGIKSTTFAEPFFTVKWISDTAEYHVQKKSILINISEQPIRIQKQGLNFLQSIVVCNTSIQDIENGLIVEDFERHTDTEALFNDVKQQWSLTYDITKEERHKGLAFWRSPREVQGDTDISMYYADSVPLNVGLHKLHWGGVRLKEVHTQIVGYGSMQQCLEQDINSLYLEEPLSPGATHRPMYDKDMQYPWHQYETITKSIFMAIQIREIQE